MFEVVARLIVGKFATVRIDHTDRAVIEVDLTGAIHGSHGIGAMQVDVGSDKVMIERAVQHDPLKELQSTDGKGNVTAGSCFYYLSFILADCPAPSPRNTGHRVDTTTSHNPDGLMVALTAINHLTCDLQTKLTGNAKNITFGRRRIRADDKIRPAESIKMSRMISNKKSHIQQFAQFSGRRWRFYPEQGIKCLGRSQVMCLGTDSADTVGDDRHLLSHSSHAELLEAAQLRHLKAGVFNTAQLIQKYFDPSVPFQSGYRVNTNSGHGLAAAFPPRIDPARPYL